LTKFAPKNLLGDAAASSAPTIMIFRMNHSAAATNYRPANTKLRKLANLPTGHNNVLTY